MKQVIWDHLRRWRWVLAPVLLFEFGVGWGITSRTQANFEFWGLLVALWAGANLLTFDLRRGLAGVMATLPLTAAQVGRSWWLATVAVPALLLPVVLLAGAGASYWFAPEGGVPAGRVALAGLFNAMWLGIIGAPIFNSISSRDKASRFMVVRGFLSTLAGLTLLGGIIFFQNASRDLMKSMLLVGVGSILVLASWHRAGRIRLGRAEETVLTRLPQTPTSAQAEIRRPAYPGVPGRATGLSYLVANCLKSVLYVSGTVGLMAVVWPLAGNGADAEAYLRGFTPLASLMACWFVIFFQLLPVLRQMRSMRLLPISPTRLAAGLIIMAVVPLALVGAVMALSAWAAINNSGAVAVLKGFLPILAPAALCVFLALWRGTGVDGYAWMFTTLFGLHFTAVLLRESERWQPSLSLLGTIVTACVALAFVLTRHMLLHSRYAYRTLPSPMAGALAPFRR